MKKRLGKWWVVVGVVLFFGAADAAEWNLYGSARMETFFKDFDQAGDQELQWDLSDQSNFGAKVKAGDVKGQIETGFVQNGGGLVGRVMVGEWDFGPGDLLVGQDYTPVNIFYSGQVFFGDNGLVDSGAAYNGRRPMIQLQLKGFKFAAVNIHSETDLGTGGDVDVRLPKFEARYTYSSDRCYADVFGGYQTYRIQAAAAEIDVNSFVVGLGAGVFLGPVEIAATGYLGSNTGQYGLTEMGNANARINAAGDDIVDNDTWAAMVAVRYPVTDRLRLEAGYGLISHELDDDALAPEKDDAQQYYLQAMITLAKNVYVIPEAGIIDQKQDFNGADEEETFYIGAKWQIDF